MNSPVLWGGVQKKEQTVLAGFFLAEQEKIMTKHTSGQNQGIRKL